MDNLQKINREWFETLRDRLCKDYQQLESKTKFKKTTWQRGPRAHNGGGVMMLMQGGEVFEKVGVNVSTVRGVIDERYRNQVLGAGKDGAFFATGISVVAHPTNPHVPAMHFNTRYLETTESWWGGGMDQTPSHPNKKSIELWHHTLKETCENNHKSHAEYRKQCDEYFYIRHRDEVRGAGGIFFDHLLLSYPNAYIGEFVFIQQVGEAFHRLSLQMIEQNQKRKYTHKDKQIQNRKRGRYVEFNLMYDRGTQFGLNTGGNVEAILMSLPPQAEW
jgi:coproporphyrinogen III oxidase